MRHPPPKPSEPVARHYPHVKKLKIGHMMLAFGLAGGIGWGTSPIFHSNPQRANQTPEQIAVSKVTTAMTSARDRAHLR